MSSNRPLSGNSREQAVAKFTVQIKKKKDGTIYGIMLETPGLTCLRKIQANVTCEP